MNTEVKLSQKYKNNIQSMHDSKVDQNRRKVEHAGGAINIDDRGHILFEDFNFEPEYPDESGILYGCRCIGHNFRKLLNETPVYIHPHSALAGAWPGGFDTFAKIGLCTADQPVHLKNLHEKYDVQQSGIGSMNHLGPDMTIGLREGFTGLLEKIRYYRAFNAPKNTDFYDGEELMVQGILDYTSRHVAYAYSLSEKETDENIKENYLKIAKVNENLLTNPPRTFQEACQFLAIFQSVDRIYFSGGALGQLDELLRPYFEEDIRSGQVTEEEVIWMIASLFYNDTHYSQIGGMLPDGSRRIDSRLSFLILQAAHELHIPSNLAVRVYNDGENELVKKAVSYILSDGTGPCFSLSKGIEEGFARQGYPIELARMRAKVGCNWVALPGIEYPMQDVSRINMAWPLVYAFREMMESGEPSLENLWTGFSKHLEIMVELFKDGYDWHYEVVSRNTPEIVLNLFCHGPIERGLNCAQGGVDIYDLNIDGIALATVADSFAAIEKRIVQDKKISWKELEQALNENFEGPENEMIRLMMKNIQRFGYPDSNAESWAKKIKDAYVHMVVDTPTPLHHLQVIPGMFSHGDVFYYGEKLPATPNGRKAGEPISHSNEPDPGFARGLNSFSPTLKANAVAAVQPGYGNSSPLHLDIDTHMLNGENAVETLCALIHAHNQMGGTLINLNCVTKEQIMQAHADPESNPDLVVRVTGYSAFFASLSKEYRQQVVDRYLTVE